MTPKLLSRKTSHAHCHGHLQIISQYWVIAKGSSISWVAKLKGEMGVRKVAGTFNCFFLMENDWL